MVTTWSREEEKAFENAIAMHFVEENITEDQWKKMASMVPSKSLEDVMAIESGQVPLPCYHQEAAATSSEKKPYHGISGSNGGGSRAEQEKTKGIPWTEEEHRLFLLGLDQYGKGNWRSISKNFVISRTPTQVASHAQKYFIRLNSMNRGRRRSSIHDITTVNNQALAVTVNQQQQQQQQVVKHTPVQEQLQPQPPSMGGLGMYGGAPVGQLNIAPPNHKGSAVGTPVMLPPPMGTPHHPGVAPYAIPNYPVPSPTQQHPALSTMH